MVRILIYSAAIFFWVLLVISFLIDRSRYRNCYFLFLALASSVLAMTFLAGEHQKTLLVILFNIVIVTLLIVPIFLICNGVVMLRREGRSMANLLSLFFGIIIAVGEIATLVAVMIPILVGREWVTESYLRNISHISIFMSVTVIYISMCFVVFMLYCVFLMIIPRIERGIYMDNRKTAARSREVIMKLSGAALFAALAYVSVFVFRIKVQFLTFDAKDAILAIGGMVFGPVTALVTSLLAALLEMISVSDTGFYGFIMNFLSSASFAFFASLVYKYRRSFSGALLGLGAGVAAMTAVMMGANLALTPLYLSKMGVPGADVSFVAGLIPKLLLPFNLTKSLLNAGLALLLYKPAVTAMRAAKMLPKTEGRAFGKKNTILSVAIAAAVIAGSVLFFIFGMNGVMGWFGAK